MQAFTWVQGGYWDVPPPPPLSDLFGVGVAWFASLRPWVVHGGGRPLFYAPTFLSSDEWWDEVGYPAGLEPFVVTARVAHRVLRAFIRFAPAVDVISLPLFRASEVEPPATMLARTVELLLRRFGPLSATPDVTPGAPHHSGESRQVDLLQYVRDVTALASAYSAALSGRTTATRRSRLANDLVARWSPDSLDHRFFPVLHDGAVSFQSAPESLRGYLFEYVFGRLDGSVRVLCKYCNAEFQPVIGPGPRPKYCPEHRSSRFRERVAVSTIRSRPAPRNRPAQPGIRGGLT